MTIIKICKVPDVILAELEVLLKWDDAAPDALVYKSRGRASQAVNFLKEKGCAAVTIHQEADRQGQIRPQGTTYIHTYGGRTLWYTVKEADSETSH